MVPFLNDLLPLFYGLITLEIFRSEDVRPLFLVRFFICLVTTNLKFLVKTLGIAFCIREIIQVNFSPI